MNFAKESDRDAKTQLEEARAVLLAWAAAET